MDWNSSRQWSDGFCDDFHKYLGSKTGNFWISFIPNQFSRQHAPRGRHEALRFIQLRNVILILQCSIEKSLFKARNVLTYCGRFTVCSKTPLLVFPRRWHITRISPHVRDHINMRTVWFSFQTNFFFLNSHATTLALWILLVIVVSDYGYMIVSCPVCPRTINQRDRILGGKFYLKLARTLMAEMKTAGKLASFWRVIDLTIHNQISEGSNNPFHITSAHLNIFFFVRLSSLAGPKLSPIRSNQCQFKRWWKV
jgi:hypothetical protein